MSAPRGRDEDAARDDGPTVYVLGAGASHEGGVPLSAQILPAGYGLLGELRRRGGARCDDYLDRFGEAQTRAFARVYDFVARVFQGRPSAEQMDLEHLPTLDELWALLEIGHERRAAFGIDSSPEETAAVRAALMALTYHVLVGCKIGAEGDGRRGGNGNGNGNGNGSGATIGHGHGHGHGQSGREGEDDAVVCYDRERTNPYTEFVAQLAPGDAVVVLNYDTLLDRALEAANRPIEYGTDVRRARWGGREGERQERARSDAQGAPVPLLKLHGSFAWLYCPTCNTIDDYAADVAHLPLDAHDRAARCPRDGAPREHVIIPPSLVKSYDNLHVQRIWDSAARLMRACGRLVFIGYAMSDADVQVRYLVKQATSLNRALAQPGARRVVAVNKSEAALAGYVRLFGEDRVEKVPLSFGEWMAGRGAPSPTPHRSRWPPHSPSLAPPTGGEGAFGSTGVGAPRRAGSK